MSGDSRKTLYEALHQLARQAKNGDRQALEKLLVDRTVRKVIYKVAVSMLGRDDADDMYQEVRLSVAGSIQGWAERAQVTGWIRRITICRCLNVQEERKKELEKRQQSAVVAEISTEQLSSQHLSIIKEERTEIVREALQNMGEPCSRMLSLYIFEELDKKEILARVDFQKSKFYTLWKRCWGRLMKNVTHILKNGRKNRGEDRSL